MMGIDLSLIGWGAGLGITAALSPGPIQALLISQSLKYGVKEGMLVACVPLFTDFPIFLVSVMLLSQISDVAPIMGALSFVGAFFLGYLAYGNLKLSKFQGDQEGDNPGSLKKGILTNFLNPFPYSFWLLVGAPIIIDAYRTAGFTHAGSFVLGFYVCLLGLMAVMAGGVAKSRTFITGKIYISTVRFLGGLLLIFALRLFWKSLQFFGIL